MIGRTLVALSLIAVVPTGAAAAEVLTGRDAAYIDWAARNCGMKGTPKEHGLLDAARAKGAAAFEKQYMQQFADKKLSDAANSQQQTQAMCEDIKSWYGASGSRIDGLVQSASDPASTASTNVGSTQRPKADAPSSPRVGGKQR